MKKVHIAFVFLCLVVAASAQVDDYWNATPNDVNNLLKSMKGKIDADYSIVAYKVLVYKLPSANCVFV